MVFIIDKNILRSVLHNSNSSIKETLLRKLANIPDDEQARQLIEDVDIKDVSFVALAIELKAILWTGDKKLYEGLKAKGFNSVVNLDSLKVIIENRIPFQNRKYPHRKLAKSGV